MEKLILSGAMDGLGPHRAALMATWTEACAPAEQHAKAQAVGQIDMFGVLTRGSTTSRRRSPTCRTGLTKCVAGRTRDPGALPHRSPHPSPAYSGELRRYPPGRLCDLHPTSRDTVTTAAGW